MTDEPEQEPGPAEGAGWFDPALGMRTVEAIQQVALRAASSVVDQLTSLSAATGSARLPRDPVDGRQADDGRQPTAAGRNDLRRTRADAERVIDAYADFVRMMLDVFVDAAEANGNGRGQPVSPLSPPNAPEIVTPPPVAPGGLATTEVWVHNLDTRPARAISFHCGGLTNHEQALIPAERIAFAPGSIDELTPRSSRGVELRVEVPENAPRGTYHGLVQATNLPGLCLTVALEVVGSSDGP